MADVMTAEEVTEMCQRVESGKIPDQGNVLILLSTCEQLRARLESAEAGLAAVHAHLRSGHLKCAYVGISPRLCSCGDCGALAAALGAAGERSEG